MALTLQNLTCFVFWVLIKEDWAGYGKHGDVVSVSSSSWWAAINFLLFDSTIELSSNLQSKLTLWPLNIFHTRAQSDH